MKETPNSTWVTRKVLQQLLEFIDHGIIRRCVMACNTQDFVRDPKVLEYICEGGSKIDARVRLGMVRMPIFERGTSSHLCDLHNVQQHGKGFSILFQMNGHGHIRLVVR
jgi:hypothetical protein